MSQHTKGPWCVSPPTAQHPSRACVTACSGFVRIYEAPLTAETQANAMLIAAAPDLLAACEALLKFFNYMRPGGGVLRGERELAEAASAAIAKAKGGEA